MAKFRTRYHIIDRENGHVVDVARHFVLNPAANFADYAAMHTLIGNVDPELAADLIEHLAYIDKYPDRQLSKYGVECLQHIKHPSVKFAARDWARRHGIFLPSDREPEHPAKT